jgi:hypothetical protein
MFNTECHDQVVATQAYYLGGPVIKSQTGYSYPDRFSVAFLSPSRQMLG